MGDHHRGRGQAAAAGSHDENGDEADGLVPMRSGYGARCGRRSSDHGWEYLIRTLHGPSRPGYCTP